MASLLKNSSHHQHHSRHCLLWSCYCGQLFTARVQVLEHIVLENNARRSQVLTSDCRKHVPRTTATTMNSCSETSPNSPVVFARQVVINCSEYFKSKLWPSFGLKPTKTRAQIIVVGFAYCIAVHSPSNGLIIHMAATSYGKSSWSTSPPLSGPRRYPGSVEPPPTMVFKSHRCCRKAGHLVRTSPIRGLSRTL